MKLNNVRNIALAAACALGAHAQGAVIATTGANSAVTFATNTADFTGNTSLANDYVENGLLLSWVGASANNAGCGYAGIDCYDAVSEISSAFAGNYLATNGNNAYLSIRLANGADFQAIEFAVGSGYATAYGYWQAYNDGTQTGAGNFSQGNGTILGLRDAAGFDEIRYFAFNAPNRQSGFSAPALDNVRVSAVPEPGTAAMLAAGLAALAAVRRRRR